MMTLFDHLNIRDEQFGSGSECLFPEPEPQSNEMTGRWIMSTRKLSKLIFSPNNIFSHVLYFPDNLLIQSFSGPKQMRSQIRHILRQIYRKIAIWV